MSRLRFGAPLYVHLDASRPSLGMTVLADVDDGLRALQRGDIGRYRFGPRGGEREAWSAALHALTRAKFDPRLLKTENASTALRTLAVAAGALVTLARHRPAAQTQDDISFRPA